jgi:hypothetical protein
MRALLFLIAALAILSLTLHVTDFLVRGVLWLAVAVLLILAVVKLLTGRRA